MKSCLFPWVAALLWSLPMLAQPSDMNRWLNSGTGKQRIHRLVSLGVEGEIAELAASERGHIKWRPIRSQSQVGLALLFLPCNGLAAAFLYLSEKTATGWHTTDHFGFDCHYDDSVSFETAALRNPDVDDVLVHHECEGHGTGIVQQNFNVFAVSSGKFKLVLNTEEIINANGWPESHEFRQRSKFSTLPTLESGSRDIEETRCISDNGKVSIQKRQFNWNPNAFRFQPSDFVKIKVDKKMKTVCR
jgi:hypothetical protein